MAAKTPIGWRCATQSMPAEICSRACPIIIEGMPAPVSTLSMPRRTSPRDSSIVLPCSWVQIEASSSKCFSMTLRRSKRWRARAGAGVSLHAG
jgi:hypothetical protein